jgi:NADPH:quinone reductase-like Zn-dependent oxidoreductase
MHDVASLALAETVVIQGIAIGSTQLLESLVTFIAQRDLKLPIDQTFGFTQDKDIGVYQYMKDQQHIGKVCINLS